MPGVEFQAQLNKASKDISCSSNNDTANCHISLCVFPTWCLMSTCVPCQRLYAWWDYVLVQHSRLSTVESQLVSRHCFWTSFEVVVVRFATQTGHLEFVRQNVWVLSANSALDMRQLQHWHSLAQLILIIHQLGFLKSVSVVQQHLGTYNMVFVQTMDKQGHQYAHTCIWCVYTVQWNPPVVLYRIYSKLMCILWHAHFSFTLPCLVIMYKVGSMILLRPSTIPISLDILERLHGCRPKPGGCSRLLYWRADVVTASSTCNWCDWIVDSDINMLCNR